VVVTTPERERAEWDAAAPDLPTAQRAIWNTDTPTQDERIDLLVSVIEPALKPALRKGVRVLDLGCGVGDLTRAMARRNPTVGFVGVDVSPAMLDLARNQPKGPGTVRFVLGDGRTLPRVGQLDAAWSVVLFQHIPPEAREGYVREVAERLLPGGIFCVQLVDDDATDVAQWCKEADLAVQSIERGVVFPTWSWLCAKKGRR
jgi:SAM-dependent methyltransferase